MPAYDARCPDCGLTEEINKPMAAPMPKCRRCGAQTRRVYSFTAPSIHYRAAGFYTSDVAHLESQVGKDKAGKIRRYADDYSRRKAAGRLTGYERSIEQAEALTV